MGEARIQIGAETGGFDSLVKELKDLNDSSEKTGKTLRQAFAADVLADGIGRIADKLDGLGNVGLKTAEALTKGFLAGGPLGAAFAGAGMLVAKLTEYYEKQGEAAKKAQEETRKALEKTNVALGEQQRILDEALDKEKAVALAKKDGITFEEAFQRIQKANRLSSIAEVKQKIAEWQAAEDTNRSFAREATAKLQKDQQTIYDATADRAASERKLLEQRLSVLELTDKAASKANEVENSIKGLSKGTGGGVSKKDGAGAGDELRSLYEKDEEIKAGFRAEEMAARAKADSDFTDRLAKRQIEEEKAADEEKKRIAEVRDARIKAVQEQDKANAEFAENDKKRTKEIDDAKKAAANREREMKEQVAAAGLAAGRAVLEAALFEKDATREKMQEGAKRAAFEAAFQGATALALAAIGSPGAAAAGIAAAQYAAIAAGEGIASAFAKPEGAKAKPSASSQSPSRASDRVNTRGPQEGGGPVTINISSQVLSSGRDTARLLERSFAEARRSR